MEQSRKRYIIRLTAVAAIILCIVCCSFMIGQIVERQRVKSAINYMSANVGEYEKSLIKMAEEMAAMEEVMSGGDKLMQTILSVRNNYVDPIDLDTIYEKAIPKLLSELDPHSEYIPAKMFDAVNESLAGEFDGIGIVFNAMTDTITVLNVIPQGPSDRAGVRAGDRVIRIDDRDVAGQGISQDSMVRLMRGPRGSKVKLSVKRSAIDDLVDINITRAAIEVHSVTAAFMLDKSAGIGYLRLAQFSRTSYSEICAAMERLQKEGMRSIIVDLRGNGGGFLDQVVNILNEFLDRGKLLVYTEDRHGRRVNEYSDGTGRYTDTNIAVLVDELSASSSEILAGAIQDNDRGLVIGRRTFGKGLVQAQLPYSDGSAMRLTVARYYTPSGRSIQRPYTNGDEMAYRMDLVNRINHHELFSKDSIRLDKSKEYRTLAGRVVYGGGGIMPDIFIPADTTKVSDFYNKVWDANILYRYTLDYADRNRAKLDNITSLADLDTVLDDNELITEFLQYAERHGVTPQDGDLERSRMVLLSQIRAYIGRNTLDDESGYYYNIRPIDDVMLRAIEELKAGGLK